MLIAGMLFLFTKGAISQSISLKRAQPITISNFGTNVPSTGTLNIVAIMVEFQPDSNRLTTGTGIFGEGGMPFLENNPNNIDPLPHNQAYFEAHLEFAKNYFEKSSDDQLTINYQVLPDVYQLDKKMEEYSPTGETFTNEKLAYLIRDSWEKVEENGGFDEIDLDNAEETGFIIFHAGVGRDIELLGTSLDITPLDIPSIYLRKSDLADLLDDPAFDGFEVKNGSFRITNSMILPRTESRRGLDIQDNEFVFPLSINGLLCASIGSHLGLPDLFNTETGESGIGRFGLMDGASIFSYNGLFPPEPSAWEKIALGWETPRKIDPEVTDSVFIAAASLNEPESISRYDLSSSEYFLIENRHRDIEDNGVRLTFRKNDGSEVTQTFLNTNEAFVFQESGFDTLLEKGVLIDVDNFDWALPGGYDIGADEDEGTADDRNLNGGILIWHIDEGVINSQIATGVNRNDERRGIDLEEADGSQDIGKPIPSLIDNSAAFGSPFDFWWSGNNFRVIVQGNEIQLYKNEFSPTSTPDNSSNSGSVSYFELFDFSDNSPTAYFRFRKIQPEGSPELILSVATDDSMMYNPTDEYGRAFPLAIDYVPSLGLLIPNIDGLHSYSFNTSSTGQFGGGRMQQPLVKENVFYTARRFEGSNELNIYAWRRNNGAWGTGGGFTIPANQGLVTSQNGDTIAVDGSTYAVVDQPYELLSDFRPQPVQESKRFGTEIAKNFTNSINFPIHDVTFSKEAGSYRSYVGILELANGTSGYFILEDERIIFVDPTSEDPFTTVYEGGSIDWPAIVDFNDNGSLDFVFVDYTLNQLIAVNRNGAFLDNFPLTLSTEEKFTGTPLIADFDGDGLLDLSIATQNDFGINIRLFDNSLSEFTFSPLNVGGVSNTNAAPINPLIEDNVLYAASHLGDLKGWRFENLTDAIWSSKYGNEPFNKVVGQLGDGTQPVPDFSVLNGDETYNWPNPANDFTNIRFEVEEPGGTVEITIATLSGRTVYKNTVQTRGGNPEEVSVNTSSFGSGGYYALIRATVNGRSESKLIKIAVVR